MIKPNRLPQGYYFPSQPRACVQWHIVRCPSFSHARGCMEGSRGQVSWLRDGFYSMRMLERSSQMSGSVWGDLSSRLRARRFSLLTFIRNSNLRWHQKDNFACLFKSSCYFLNVSQHILSNFLNFQLFIFILSILIVPRQNCGSIFATGYRNKLAGLYS